MRRSVEIAVIGAGPAGALTARILASRGFDVLLVDRGVHPRWKVCGCCLGARAVAALQAEGLGELPRRLGGRTPSTLLLTASGRQVALPHQGTTVVSRTALDAALVAGAVESGAEHLAGWSATLGAPHRTHRRLHLRRDGEERTVEARLVVGATGLTPLPTRPDAAGPLIHVDEASRIGVGAVFEPGEGAPLGAAPDRIHMVAGRSGYLGISVLEDGSVDLAGALDPACIRRAGGVGEAVHALLDEVGLAPPGSPPRHGWKGTPALTRRAVRPGAHRLFLVGDAAGYVEPFTGEGMSWALESAGALAPLATDVLSRGWSPTRVAEWNRLRRRAVGSRALIRGVAWLTRHPVAVRASLALLARAPRLARPLLRHATGAAPSPSAPVPSTS